MRTDLCRGVGVAVLVLALAAPIAAHPSEVLAGYDAWIRQHPKDPSGYRARGRLNLVLGKAGAAAADLAKAVRLKPNDSYNVLWLHFARNKESASDAMELQVNAARADRAAWPGPLVDYMTGKIDASAVLTKAGEGKAKATRMCEAELFLGQDDLAKGRHAQGLERLQAAARDCDAREAILARANLPGEQPPVLTQASAPAPEPAFILEDPTFRPASIRLIPQPQPQPQSQRRPRAADPLMLRGSLR